MADLINGQTDEALIATVREHLEGYINPAKDQWREVRVKVATLHSLAERLKALTSLPPGSGGRDLRKRVLDLIVKRDLQAVERISRLGEILDDEDAVPHVMAPHELADAILALFAPPGSGEAEGWNREAVARVIDPVGCVTLEGREDVSRFMYPVRRAEALRKADQIIASAPLPPPVGNQRLGSSGASLPSPPRGDPKHTSGPWMLGNRDGWRVDASNCTYFTVVAKGRKAPVAFVCGRYIRDDKETDAHARLIVAAPRLLGALRALAAAVATTDVAAALLIEAPAAWANVGEVLAEAEAAIAGATGQ